MPRTKSRWVSIGDFPESCQPLLRAFNELFGLHHRHYVVRMATGGPTPVVIVQVFSRMTAGDLHALEGRADCRVEVEALSRGYLMVMLFGNQEQSPVPGPRYINEPGQFLFRPMAK